MENKEKYLLSELALTCILLFLPVFLLAETLSAYRMYIIFGLIAGFYFSWSIRDKENQFIRIFPVLATIAVFAGVIYSVLNSALLYREVIRICIKGVLVLGLVYSFTACAPSFLNHIQVLSVLLFVSSFVITKGKYKEFPVIPVGAYLTIWFVILKIKFYSSFHPPDKENKKLFASLPVAGAVFSLILVSSWLLFCFLPLGQNRKGGVIFETGLGEESEPEKAYYDLQDKLQEEIIKSLPNRSSPQEKQEIVYLLSMLIKEPQDTVEVDKAEEGLISYLKQSGPGLEKAKEKDPFIVSLLKSYVTKKITRNIKKEKEKLMDLLKKIPLDIKNRIAILVGVNKTQGSDSYADVAKYAGVLINNIRDSSLAVDAKTDAEEFARAIKDWKIFEIYRKNKGFLSKSVESLDIEFQRKFSEFYSRIKDLDVASDYNEMDSKLAELKESAPAEGEDFINKVEMVSALSLEMFFSEKSGNLKEKLEFSVLPGNKINEFKKSVNSLADSSDYQDFSRHLQELKEKSEKEHFEVSGELKELSEIAAYSLIKESAVKIGDMLKETILPEDKKGDLLKAVENLKSVRGARKLAVEIKELESAVEQFSGQGMISQENRARLIKTIEQLKEFLLFQMAEKEKKSAGKVALADIQGKWEEMIEKFPLKEATKEMLRKLTEEFFKAGTISNIENIKQAVEKELEAVSGQGMTQEAGKLKEAFEQIFELKKIEVINKTLAGLRKDTEELKRIEPEISSRVEAYLRKLINSPGEREFPEKLSALKDYVNSSGFSARHSVEEHKQFDPWQIYMMPARLAAPVGAVLPLKVIAVYNNIFFKDLNSELEWFSAEPAVAVADAQGAVHFLSKGTTKIGVKYRGKTIEGAEVVAIDKMAEGTTAEIKDYLIQNPR